MIFNDPAPCGLRTDYGVSRMADPKACATACPFIQPGTPAAPGAPPPHGTRAYLALARPYGMIQ